MQGILITLGNAVLVLAVLYWSGRVTEKTLYDQHAISVESISIAVSDVQKAARFYSDVLNFKPLFETKGAIRRNTVGFELPDKKRLYFHKRISPTAVQCSAETPKTAESALIMQVKNGFQSFHKALLSRSGQEAQVLAGQDVLSSCMPGSISEIFKGSYGQQFIASDPDGNLILFYQGRKLRV